jgi:hypothetical protein
LGGEIANILELEFAPGTTRDRDDDSGHHAFWTSCRICDDLKLPKVASDTGQRSEVHEQANKNDIAT